MTHRESARLRREPGAAKAGEQEPTTPAEIGRLEVVQESREGVR